MIIVRMWFWDVLAWAAWWVSEATDRRRAACLVRYHRAQRERWPHLFK